jgi:N-acetylglucosaminyldiphosphoundecaprenol N-acetyl-beta-D-mannosaminyltransferase
VTSYDEVMEILQSPSSQAATVVAICNVHSVMTARKQPELAAALSDATICTPDGMPLVWMLRALGISTQERVYGPELMRRALRDGKDKATRHYLYGSTPETLESLRLSIESNYPQATICGALSPQFRPLTDDEMDKDLRQIRASSPDIVWVGLGMPKQELWMSRARWELPGVALVGVGAAFDMISNRVRQAPEWMQRGGLEWLFRFAQEPRRLWRRYAIHNPAFMTLAAWELVKRAIRRSRE